MHRLRVLESKFGLAEQLPSFAAATTANAYLQNYFAEQRNIGLARTFNEVEFVYHSTCLRFDR